MVFASENPFNSQRIHVLPYVFDATTPNVMLGRFDALGRRAAIVGPHGHGKTTLLDALETPLAARNVETLRLALNDATPRNEKRAVLRRITASQPDAIILMDGAEQLGWLAWRRLLRACGPRGLIITTHRAGRLPTLHECRTSPELMERLLAQLLGPESERWRAEALDLYTRHRGNLREVWFALYDRFANEAA